MTCRDSTSVSFPSVPALLSEFWTRKVSAQMHARIPGNYTSVRPQNFLSMLTLYSGQKSSILTVRSSYSRAIGSVLKEQQVVNPSALFDAARVLLLGML